jgi:hypothetical protein
MTRPLTILALVAAAALAGCDNSSQDTDAGADNQSTNNVAVVLPPSIQASKAYRCKDNSLVYVDWLSDGSARVKKDRNEVGTPTLTGEGNPLQGDAKAASITYNGQSCKA